MKYAFSSFMSISVLLVCMICCKRNANKAELLAYCGAEKLSGNKKAFIHDKHVFGNPETRTEKMVHSGKYAVCLTKESPYGMTFMDKHAHADAYYDISVWRHGKNGALVLSDEKGKIYVLSDVSDSVTQTGWERIRLQTFIPPTFEEGIIKIYVWNTGGEPVYFDDLTISRKKEKTYPVFQGNVLHLKIDSLGMDRLRSIRYSAFIRGSLQSDEWIEGFLKYQGKEMPVKLRLKGDWLDHLQGEKWSFRIKLKKGYAWKGLREFSIQDPGTRNYLAEWILHQLLKSEDLLTTRYGFIPVSINGKSLGVYAWEEHFTKQLPESNGRREAPILKFDEKAFWDWIVFFDANNPIVRYLPKFDAADILPFKKKSTMKSAELKALFLTGQSLLTQFKERSVPCREVINPDAMAKYYAITSLTSSFHGFSWHNLRFYVNPFTQLLDPIAFDGYPGVAITDAEFQRILGYNAENKCTQTVKDKEEFMLKSLLNDTAFRSDYEHYLEIFTEPAYLDTFMSHIENEAKQNEILIRREFPSYHYQYDFLRKKAALIKSAMHGHTNHCKTHFVYAPDSLVSDTDYCSLETPLQSMAVKAFIEREHNGQWVLSILNYHCRPLKLNGCGSGGIITSRFPEKTILPAKQPDSLPKVFHFNSIGGVTQVFYSELNGGPVYAIDILPWAYPAQSTSRQNILVDALQGNRFYSKRDSMIVFHPGRHKIRENIVVPPGYRVTIPGGTILDMTDSAAFISFSPVDINGTAAEPVIIKSSDGTGNGFNVISATGISHITHTGFDNMGALGKGSWTLTGAVTFYESDVLFNRCTFTNNRCEDALNVVRSDMHIKQSLFENTRFDALDCDFCTGMIDTIWLKHIGNDGLDFSGSEVSVAYCRVADVIDKGISAGEGSRITLLKAEIQSGNIGVCSKDNSSLAISKLVLSKCNYGYALFRKKPEYGPASITVKKAYIKKITTMHIIDLDCMLKVGNEQTKGKQRLDVSAFYN